MCLPRECCACVFFDDISRTGFFIRQLNSMYFHGGSFGHIGNTWLILLRTENQHFVMENDTAALARALRNTSVSAVRTIYHMYKLCICTERRTVCRTDPHEEMRTCRFLRYRRKTIHLNKLYKISLETPLHHFLSDPRLLVGKMHQR